LSSRINRMAVYKGEQSFQEFLVLSHQGILFDAPEVDRAQVQKRLNAIAMRVVADIGADADDFELRCMIKDRYAGRGVYDSGMVVEALRAALRIRQPFVKRKTR